MEFFPEFPDFPEIFRFQIFLHQTKLHAMEIIDQAISSLNTTRSMRIERNKFDM